MAASSPISDLLDDAERSGQLNLSTEDLRGGLPDLSSDALRQAVQRQQRRGRLVHLSRGSNHWLIVPLKDSVIGAPPLETWLHRYMNDSLGIAYYVALLSAAEAYGASPYGVTTMQVMVSERRRPITVGRHKIVFHARARIDSMPTSWYDTVAGRFKVGTPELTALELVQRAAWVGGTARVREVLSELSASCTAQGIAVALDAVQEVATAQRLGALLSLDGRDILASQIAEWLRNKPMRLVPLKRGQTGNTKVDSTFKVRLPVTLGPAGT